jgi:hypothetical protein
LDADYPPYTALQQEKLCIAPIPVNNPPNTPGAQR